jgi:hypothetical protein
MREIWLLRLRALLARAHGDAAAYADFRDRYRDMARSLGFDRDLLQQYRAMATKLGRLGHMAMSDSWTVRAAAAGASRMLSASAKMSRNPVWNKAIQWSTTPRRRR